MRYATESAKFHEGQAYHPSGASPDAPYPRQPYHHPRTSLGAAGHWIHLAAIAAPLIIGEVVKDPEQRWRALRLASVGAAVASEAVWTHRLTKDRQKDEETRAALKSCSDHCR
jgi:hypothetical protein